MKDREPALTPPYTGRLWLLGALFLVSLPHLLRMPPWLSLGCLGVFLWRLLHETRGIDLPGRWLRTSLVVLGIGSVLLIHHSVAGREPGVALLTVMLCLKLMELRTIRDAMIALFIGYFMVISGFLFSQSIFMGGYLFLVVLALTAALAALNHPAGRASDNRHYLTFSTNLLLQSLPLMVLMFLLFPRLSGPLWHMPDDKASARTGLSDSMEPGTITNLVDSEEVAFRVDFDGAMPAASQLYWRGPVLWATDGRRWQALRMQAGRTLPPIETPTSAVGYTITLEPNQRRWLFAMDLPVEIPQGLAGEVLVRPDLQLLYSLDITTKLRYALRSSSNARLTYLPPWMERLATRLPPGTNPRSRALAQQWADQGLSAAAIVERALAFYREQPFYYTRQPPALGAEPVDDFLFTSRRGFCEHYAASFVTLMRAAAIPARVVTGYQGGERNRLGDYLIVRQSDAHAWAEVWLDGRGWVRVDPTAMIPPDRVETTADTGRFQSTEPAALGGGRSFLSGAYWKLRHSWDAVNHTWNQWVLGFDRETQERLLRKLGLKDLSWQWLITLMVLLLGGVLALISLGILRRRPRQTDPVLRLYQQFCDKLAKAGVVRHPDEGPADFSRRAAEERPELAEAVNAISERYIRLRYTREAASGAIEELRRLVRGFQV